MTKPVVSLVDAFFTLRPNYGFECVRGYVADNNHPRLWKGEHIWTSPIVSVNEAENLVETENTIYQVESWRSAVRVENQDMEKEVAVEGDGYAIKSVV